ncbi:hypothetical protein TWF481_006870 [Arthrobotrys musiformis]|uniref:Uncharacterized protein n=1 Tax=Arthrobotrys musiformis TaxID=47236 RepID=A0AAV9WAS3_9PEZI
MVGVYQAVQAKGSSKESGEKAAKPSSPVKRASRFGYLICPSKRPPRYVSGPVGSGAGVNQPTRIRRLFLLLFFIFIFSEKERNRYVMSRPTETEVGGGVKEKNVGAQRRQFIEGKWRVQSDAWGKKLTAARQLALLLICTKRTKRKGVVATN